MNLDLKALGEGIGGLIRDHFKRYSDVYDKRLATLAQRVTDLEERTSQVKFAGTFQRADSQRYKKGNFVTHQGSLWAVLRDAPSGEPGQSADFQLCVKKGRDAPRDGR